MSLAQWLLWSLSGMILAFVFLKSQSWTVMLLSPQRPALSKWMVIGGAILRWLTIAVLLILALSQSIGAALAVFFCFMGTRFLLLFLGQTLFLPEPLRPTSLKD